MTTLRAWWLVLRGRLLCRLLGWHDDGVRISHGYAVTWCQRCWRCEVERVAEGML